ncbi:MAG: uracil-DNA glycosylase [Pseudomonadota bacterium]
MTSERLEILDLARQVRNYLDYMASLGVTHLPRTAAVDLPAAEPPKAETLEDIRQDLGECTRCPLCQNRTNIVFGEGAAKAEVVFVGEGPGREEDLQGRPFVGAAGRLLTDIIVKGMKMRREDVYIANVVKCRPPENREPQPLEAKTCLPFLQRQIASIRPRIIIALGRVAAHYLLDTSESLHEIRNRLHDYQGIPLVPTYHPAAILYDARVKRPVWEDIKKVLALLT